MSQVLSESTEKPILAVTHPIRVSQKTKFVDVDLFIC